MESVLVVHITKSEYERLSKMEKEYESLAYQKKEIMNQRDEYHKMLMKISGANDSVTSYELRSMANDFLWEQVGSF